MSQPYIHMVMPSEVTITLPNLMAFAHVWSKHCNVPKPVFNNTGYLQRWVANYTGLFFDLKEDNTLRLIASALFYNREHVTVFSVLSHYVEHSATNAINLRYEGVGDSFGVLSAHTYTEQTPMHRVCCQELYCDTNDVDNLLKQWFHRIQLSHHTFTPLGSTTICEKDLFAYEEFLITFVVGEVVVHFNYEKPDYEYPRATGRLYCELHAKPDDDSLQSIVSTLTDVGLKIRKSF